MHYDQYFFASNCNKGKYKNSANKPLVAGQSSNASPSGEKKKKKRCNYYRKPGHDISECRKIIASKKKKKESGLTVSNASGGEVTHEQVNFARD